jgi:hypothetical protein
MLISPPYISSQLHSFGRWQLNNHGCCKESRPPFALQPPCYNPSTLLLPTRLWCHKFAPHTIKSPNWFPSP